MTVYRPGNRQEPWAGGSSTPANPAGNMRKVEGMSEPELNIIVGVSLIALVQTVILLGIMRLLRNEIVRVIRAQHEYVVRNMPRKRGPNKRTAGKGDKP